VISGHSGSTSVLEGLKSEGAKTPEQLQQIHDVGGMSGIFAGQGDRVRPRNSKGITQHPDGPVNDCGHSSKTFAQVYLAAVDAAGGPGVAAVGFGTDFNGINSMPGPRFGFESCAGDDEQAPQANAVQYPFSIFARPGVNAGHLSKSASPNRFTKFDLYNSFETPHESHWDVNFDGLGHMGLLPDFIQDLRQVGLTDAQLQPLFRSAEGYVRMWEKAEATAPIVTAPASITIVATEIGGARGSASPVLHNFLSGATAVSAGLATALPPYVIVIRGEDGTVTDQTLFGIGTTTVFFGFVDAKGHVGTASATVTVTGLVIAHAIDLTETIHVRDELPISEGTLLQADLVLTDTIHVRDDVLASASRHISVAEPIRVHDDVLTNGSGSAGPAHRDISVAEPIRVHDDVLTNGSGSAGPARRDINVAEPIHVRDQFPLSGNSLAFRYRALDPNGADSGITAQFTDVVVPGVVTATLVPSPPPPPAGFTFVGGVYDVVLISGSVTPPIELCFTGTGFTAANRVLHHETTNGVAQWIDRTTTQTPTEVCATVNSLSPFALAVRLAPPPAPDGLIYGAGFIDSGRQHHHFVFRASQLRGHVGGNLEYWVTDPRSCRTDDDDDRHRRFDGNHESHYRRDHHRPSARFEATDITDVTFSDNPAVRPGARPDGAPATDTVRFKGVGKWNGRSGYSFEATASDRGEPGRRRDTFSLVVKDARGTIVANISGSLDEGNIQSVGVR
jgi:hypothetical protein